MDTATRVRNRIVPLDPRVTLCGNQLALDNGKWILPPLANEANLTYEDPVYWYESCKRTVDELHSGPPYISGGPFTSYLLSKNYAQPQGYGWYGKDRGIMVNFTNLGVRQCSYKGGFLPIWPSDSSLPSVYRNTWDVETKMKTDPTLAPDVSSWGPTAWAKSAPKIEMASGFVFLAEGRDLPRMLKTTSRDFHEIWKTMGGNVMSAKQAPKRVSDSFLNQQFGWSPFLSDLGKFYTAYQQHSTWLSRMTRGNDKWKVYRRTLLNDYRETKLFSGSTWTVTPGLNQIQNFTNGKPMQWEIWEEKLSLITSTGKFKWYRPDFDFDNSEFNSAYNNIMRQSTLYGVRISPSNIWRATPWTWLIDWGFNVGRNIDRLTEYLQDGVVSQYLYLMQHTQSRLSLRVSIPFTTGTVSMTFYRNVESKIRREAGSPYGFDSPWESLTPKRLAILAALGISRNG